MKRTPLKRKTPLRNWRNIRPIRPSIQCAFPKPKDVYRETKAVIYYPDGREVCTNTPVGQREYKRRTLQMAERTGQICCLFGYSPVCHPRGLLLGYVPTFEHENGRGGGKRDDRIELPDGTWINGAAHVQCNQWKGSRRIPYNSERNGKKVS